jgi:Zn-dependent protease with chaperone function
LTPGANDVVKTVGFIVAGIIYIAVSCWVVGGIGMAHREVLGERERRSLAEAPSIKPSSGAKDHQVVVTAEKPEPPRRPSEPAASERKPPVVEERPPTLLAAKPASTAPPPTPVEKTSAAKSADTSAAPAPQPQGLQVIDPFFAGPIAKKKWDLARLTTAQELELGRQLNHMVLLPRLNRELKNGAMERRILEAAEPILAARTRKDVDFRFVIIDSEYVNAFSHPGGFIYVTRGLMNWIGEDEEYALRFALAHEIYHVDRGHAILCLQDPEVLKLPLGTLELFYLLIFPRGYSPNLEFEADVWALRQLQQLKHSKRESLAFMQKLDRYAEANGFLQGSMAPESGRAASLFENHYRAHPNASTRLKKLKAIVYPTAKATK